MASEASAGRPANLSSRIEAMFRQDRIWAWGFVFFLWLALAFVLLESIPFMSGSVAVAAWVAAIVLAVFNTASIGAMVRHYSHDKEHIYGTDIRHLDAGR
jgi:hypothetical protein